jgi:hypothetical protein
VGRADEGAPGGGSMTEDQVYLRNVRGLPCLLAWTKKCLGRVHAHHAGERPGMSRKAPDDTAVPLCVRHHVEWHDASGHFASLDKAGRRLWAEAAIVDTQTRLAPF